MGKKGTIVCLHLKDLVVVCCFIFCRLTIAIKEKYFFFHKYFFFIFFHVIFLNFWSIYKSVEPLCQNFRRCVLTDFWARATHSATLLSLGYSFSTNMSGHVWKPNATAQYASLFHNMTFWNAKNRIKKCRVWEMWGHPQMMSPYFRGALCVEMG